MPVSLVINSCRVCPYKDFEHDLEEYVCSLLRHNGNKYVLGKLPLPVSKEIRVTYKDKDEIPVECPLRKNKK